MKKLSLLVLVCFSFFGCINSEKHPSDWTPKTYNVPVECCVEADQVRGAIRMALIKRDWPVYDIKDNKVYSHLSCIGTDADVIFSNTDKYYSVTFENIMESDYSDHDCIYDRVNDINNIIGKYIKKTARKNAKLELKATKKAAKQ